MVANPFNQPGLYLRSGIILSVLLGISNSLAITQLALSLVMVTIVAIGPLLSTPAPSIIRLEDLVHDAYVTSANVAAATLLVPLVYILLLAWTLNNSYTFLRQYGTGVFERMGSTLRNIRLSLKIKKSR